MPFFHLFPCCLSFDKQICSLTVVDVAQENPLSCVVFCAICTNLVLWSRIDWCLEAEGQRLRKDFACLPRRRRRERRSRWLTWQLLRRLNTAPCSSERCAAEQYAICVNSLHFLKHTRGLQNKSSGVPYVVNTTGPQIYNRELYRTDLSKRESYLVWTVSPTDSNSAVSSFFYISTHKPIRHPRKNPRRCTVQTGKHMKCEILANYNYTEKSLKELLKKKMQQLENDILSLVWIVSTQIRTVYMAPLTGTQHTALMTTARPTCWCQKH